MESQSDKVATEEEKETVDEDKNAREASIL